MRITEALSRSRAAGRLEGCDGATSTGAVVDNSPLNSTIARRLAASHSLARWRFGGTCAPPEPPAMRGDTLRNAGHSRAAYVLPTNRTGRHAPPKTSLMRIPSLLYATPGPPYGIYAHPRRPLTRFTSPMHMGAHRIGYRPTRQECLPDTLPPQRIGSMWESSRVERRYAQKGHIDICKPTMRYANGAKWRPPHRRATRSSSDAQWEFELIASTNACKRARLGGRFRLPDGSKGAELTRPLAQTPITTAPFGVSRCPDESSLRLRFATAPSLGRMSIGGLGALPVIRVGGASPMAIEDATNVRRQWHWVVGYRQ